MPNISFLRNILVCSIAIFCCLSATAGNGDPTSPDTAKTPISNFDSSYIKSYYSKLCITALSIAKNNTFTVNNLVNSSDITYSTNKVVTYGFALDYKWLALELTLPIRAISREDPELGSTNGFGFTFGFTKRRLWFRTFYQDNKGYYLSSDFNDFNKRKNKDKIRPDIRNEIFFASLYYGFNYKKFSYMAALWQIEKQKKSAASFTGGITFAKDRISGDSSLIPRPLLEGDSTLTPFTSNGNYYYAINFGGAGTVVIAKHFFLSGTFIPGISLQHGTWKDENGNSFKKNLVSSFALDLKIGGGYVGDKFYCGLNFFSNQLTSYGQGESLEISQDYVNFRIFAGYRFTVPQIKFLRKVWL